MSCNLGVTGSRVRTTCACVQRNVCVSSQVLLGCRCRWAEAWLELGSGLKCWPGVSAGWAWVRGQKVGGVRAAGLRGRQELCVVLGKPGPPWVSSTSAVLRKPLGLHDGLSLPP